METNPIRWHTDALCVCLQCVLQKRPVQCCSPWSLHRVITKWTLSLMWRTVAMTSARAQMDRSACVMLCAAMQPPAQPRECWSTGGDKDTVVTISVSFVVWHVETIRFFYLFICVVEQNWPVRMTRCTRRVETCVIRPADRYPCLTATVTGCVRKAVSVP